jgi:hypothetical protein
MRSILIILILGISQSSIPTVQSEVLPCVVTRWLPVVPPDTIPALTNPAFHAHDGGMMPKTGGFETAGFTEDTPVIGVEINGESRAYPHNLMWWHEIVNDTLGGRSIAVTFCPLTGTGMVFERMVEGELREFGVSGNLHNNNLIMYDRVSDSLVSQLCKRGIEDDAPLEGVYLEMVPAIETTWRAWKALHPETTIVGFDNGHSRSYTRYPYGDYRTDHEYILFPYYPVDTRLETKDPVLAVFDDADATAYPLSILATEQVVNDTVGAISTVVMYDIASETARAFRRDTSGQMLTFFVTGDFDGAGFPLVQDVETGSRWNFLGEAVSGSLAGERLEPVARSVRGFWFGLSAFYQGIEVYDGCSGCVNVDDEAVPQSFLLDQNRPNPFNGTTVISYRLTEASPVTVTVYNIAGQSVRTLVNAMRSPGAYDVAWDGRDESGRSVHSGVYVYRIIVGSTSEARRMLYLK